jgi:hypothetical protein
MDALLAFCKWLERTPLGTEVRESLWLFPTIETIHLLGMALLVGTVAALDLRLWGFAMRREPVSRLAARLLPWTWLGFAVMVVTGSLLFSANPLKTYIHNPSFQLKMLLIFLAGVNALVFHLTVYRRVSRWDYAAVTPAAARTAAALSLLLWVGVIAAGRWIGFV